MSSGISVGVAESQVESNPKSLGRSFIATRMSQQKEENWERPAILPEAVKAMNPAGPGWRECCWPRGLVGTLVGPEAKAMMRPVLAQSLRSS